MNLQIFMDLPLEETKFIYEQRGGLMGQRLTRSDIQKISVIITDREKYNFINIMIMLFPFPYSNFT